MEMKLSAVKIFIAGVVTSPNYPGEYPNYRESTETIQVESGKVLRLEFTRFAVWYCGNCNCDHLKITDGDGKTLMDKSCGESSISRTSSGYFQPPVIVTNTNTVEIFFHTDRSNTKSGWSLSWTAVTPGLKTLLATLLNCPCTVKCLYFALLSD